MAIDAFRTGFWTQGARELIAIQLQDGYRFTAKYWTWLSPVRRPSAAPASELLDAPKRVEALA
jgi:hypothetical protein